MTDIYKLVEDNPAVAEFLERPEVKAMLETAPPIMHNQPKMAKVYYVLERISNPDDTEHGVVDAVDLYINAISLWAGAGFLDVLVNFSADMRKSTGVPLFQMSLLAQALWAGLAFGDDRDMGIQPPQQPPTPPTTPPVWSRVSTAWPSAISKEDESTSLAVSVLGAQQNTVLGEALFHETSPDTDVYFAAVLERLASRKVDNWSKKAVVLMRRLNKSVPTDAEERFPPGAGVEEAAAIMIESVNRTLDEALGRGPYASRAAARFGEVTDDEDLDAERILALTTYVRRLVQSADAANPLLSKPMLVAVGVLNTVLVVTFSAFREPMPALGQFVALVTHWYGVYQMKPWAVNDGRTLEQQLLNIAMGFSAMDPVVAERLNTPLRPGDAGLGTVGLVYAVQFLTLPVAVFLLQSRAPRTTVWAWASTFDAVVPPLIAGMVYSPGLTTEERQRVQTVFGGLTGLIVVAGTLSLTNTVVAYVFKVRPTRGQEKQYVGVAAVPPPRPNPAALRQDTAPQNKFKAAFDKFKAAFDGVPRVFRFDAPWRLDMGPSNPVVEYASVDAWVRAREAGVGMYRLPANTPGATTQDQQGVYNGSGQIVFITGIGQLFTFQVRPLPEADEALAKRIMKAQRARQV